ncbi:MAG: aminotransferase class V-fold PLP-dependent enzyme [Candidatus Eisenbacteria bacterium]|uniref:Aminotransferase class V-fold PLP-dependent enzyme n=1 Tax=Eiseniibacteriota bacterium TaxID=2212470 RepID=A0A7Y2H114_UNCEI|nr:aminotransferase class V-fold PLP-dependent enzyme [Candidatus Eisenbacteria bacterium]
MIYLNQAGTSWPKPSPVREAVQDALTAPVESWANRFNAQHQAICAAFGVGNPERLLLTPGATSALSVGILDHPWQSGDRVLVSGLEHHALYRPVQQLADRGVEVGIIPPGEGGAIALSALRAELQRGGVRMVAMTAACNVTGDVLPIKQIVSLAHEYDALVLIDAAQITGWVPVDVMALDVDLLAFTGHKGAQAPWGIGGLYVAERVLMSSPSAACELPVDGEPACSTMPGYCDAGSVDRAALAGLVAGFRWLAAPERSNRLEVARKRVAILQEVVSGRPGVTLHAYTPLASRMPTLALTVLNHSPAELASALSDRGILVAAGLQCAPLAHETLGTAPSGVLRMSFGPGNEDGDVDIAAAALGEVLEDGPA